MQEALIIGELAFGSKHKVAPSGYDDLLPSAQGESARDAAGAPGIPDSTDQRFNAAPSRLEIMDSLDHWEEPSNSTREEAESVSALQADHDANLRSLNQKPF